VWGQWVELRCLDTNPEATGASRQNGRMEHDEDPVTGEDVEMTDANRDHDLSGHFAATFDPALLERLLIGAGIHPDDMVTLLRYAPLGLTHLCWRNSVLEDWHAGPDSRIGDADMMRANVETTRLFHQALWSAFGEQLANAELMCRTDLTDDDIFTLEDAFGDALEVAFTADRVLPHGATLGEIGGNKVAELYDHAEVQLGALLVQADQHGVAIVLMWLALRARLSCSGWWGSPRWPLIVDAFLARLDNPEDDWWVRYSRPELPPDVADTAQFRHRLLTAPDQLSTETLRFCIDRAGIGFVRVEE
jgi:hypothetical protein